MTQLDFAKTSLKIEDLKPRARDLNAEETADMLGGWGFIIVHKPGGGGQNPKQPHMAKGMVLLQEGPVAHTRSAGKSMQMMQMMQM